MLDCKTGVFDNGLERIGIKPRMIRDGYTVNPIRHADMLTFSDNPESDFAERPNRSFSRDICKEHLRRKPLLHRLWHLLSLRQSCGGMFQWRL